MKQLKQSEFHYTISPYHKPALKVGLGETVKVDCIDAAGETYKIPPQWNPLSGPIYVEGASKGDTLVVNIDNIKLTKEKGISPFFYDTDALSEALLNPTVEPRIVSVKNGEIKLENITLPANPSIGGIGTAPEKEVISTEKAGKHGGNMDDPRIRAGTKVFLPVNVDGALLFVGDIHAIQAEGEFFCVDISGEVTLTFNVVKGKKVNWPRLESSEYLMSISSSADVREAIYQSYKELVLWVEEESGLERADAYRLCAQVATIRTAKIVRPQAVMSVLFPKKYLPLQKHNKEIY